MEEGAGFQPVFLFIYWDLHFCGVYHCLFPRDGEYAIAANVTHPVARVLLQRNTVLISHSTKETKYFLIINSLQMRKASFIVSSSNLS